MKLSRQFRYKHSVAKALKSSLIPGINVFGEQVMNKDRCYCNCLALGDILFLLDDGMNIAGFVCVNISTAAELGESDEALGHSSALLPILRSLRWNWQCMIFT